MEKAELKKPARNIRGSRNSSTYRMFVAGIFLVVIAITLNPTTAFGAVGIIFIFTAISDYGGSIEQEKEE